MEKSQFVAELPGRRWLKSTVDIKETNLFLIIMAIIFLVCFVTLIICVLVAYDVIRELYRAQVSKIKRSLRSK